MGLHAQRHVSACERRSWEVPIADFQLVRGPDFLDNKARTMTSHCTAERFQLSIVPKKRVVTSSLSVPVPRILKMCTQGPPAPRRFKCGHTVNIPESGRPDVLECETAQLSGTQCQPPKKASQASSHDRQNKCPPCKRVC